MVYLYQLTSSVLINLQDSAEHTQITQDGGLAEFQTAAMLTKCYVTVATAPLCFQNVRFSEYSFFFLLDDDAF